MSGTRDAGALWELTCTNALLEAGFIQGVSNPCWFHHPEWHLALVVHGDDFVDENLSRYEGLLKQAFVFGECTRLGLGPEHVREHRILNRILRVDEAGLKWEADPRHLELLAKSLRLETCRQIGTPGVKPTSADATDPDQEEETFSRNNPHDNSNPTQTPNPQHVSHIQRSCRNSRRGKQQQL